MVGLLLLSARSRRTCTPKQRRQVSLSVSHVFLSTERRAQHSGANVLARQKSQRAWPAALSGNHTRLTQHITQENGDQSLFSQVNTKFSIHQIKACVDGLVRYRSTLSTQTASANTTLPSCLASSTCTARTGGAAAIVVQRIVRLIAALPVCAGYSRVMMVGWLSAVLEVLGRDNAREGHLALGVSNHRVAPANSHIQYAPTRSAKNDTPARPS